MGDVTAAPPAPVSNCKQKNRHNRHACCFDCSIDPVFLCRRVFAILENVEGGIYIPVDVRLSWDEWDVIEMGEAVLEPLMFAQRILEGELYVTNSLVAPIIFQIRDHLAAALLEQQQKQVANAPDIVLCMEKVIAAFEER